MHCKCTTGKTLAPSRSHHKNQHCEGVDQDRPGRLQELGGRKEKLHSRAASSSDFIVFPAALGIFPKASSPKSHHHIKISAFSSSLGYFFFLRDIFISRLPKFKTKAVKINPKDLINRKSNTRIPQICCLYITGKRISTLGISHNFTLFIEEEKQRILSSSATIEGKSLPAPSQGSTSLKHLFSPTFPSLTSLVCAVPCAQPSPCLW